MYVRINNTCICNTRFVCVSWNMEKIKKKAQNFVEKMIDYMIQNRKETRKF
jgi:hypothetical protein